MEITTPTITRLARRAGVKNISKECYSCIRALMVQRLDYVIQDALVINSQKQKKTLMVDSIYESLELRGINLAQSQDLGTNNMN